MPDRKMMQVKLPDAGSIGGRSVSLTVSATESRATFGLAIEGKKALAAGIVGQTHIGEESYEVGSFRLNGENLRVFAKTVWLEGFRI